jgi:hypothetical protein
VTWAGFWFLPGNAIYLGVVRVLFMVTLFITVKTVRLPQFGQLYLTVPTAYYPTTFYRWFPRSFPRWIATHAVMLERLWYAAILLAGSGLLFPLGSIAVAVLTLFLIGLRKQFGKIVHAKNTLPLFAIILACAPADALCIGPSFPLVDAAHGYFWPLQLGRVLVALVWFSAGIAKLRYGGRRWIFSDYLSKLLRLHVFDYYFVPPRAPSLSRWIANHQALCVLLAIGTHILELGFPLALFHPWAALFFVPSSLLLIIGFVFAQGPFFRPLMILTILVWFPYHPLLALLH